MLKVADRTSGLVPASPCSSSDDLVLEACTQSLQREAGEKKTPLMFGHKLHLPHLALRSEEAVNEHLGAAHCQWTQLK